MRVALFAFSVAACGSSTTTSAPPANREPAAPAATPEKRCLPVIAKECGCTYSCGAGVRDGTGWRVTHSFWKGNDLKAAVERYCVGGACTEVFSAEIVCDGICPPKAADPTCHFDGSGACVGAAP